MSNIQLLAEQVNNQARDVFSGQADGMVVTRDDLVKFADLIIQEMLRTCAEHPAWYGRMIAEEIKQHFEIDK